MANQSSSPSPLLSASFSQDNRGFSISTRDGFKIFDSESGKLCYERSIGAFGIVEMLFGSSLLAIVGAGEQVLLIIFPSVLVYFYADMINYCSVLPISVVWQPSLSPRRLCLFNTVTGTAIRELNFLTSILAVRINRKRLVVILQERTYIYDLNSLIILDTIDTVPNTKGLCAFSPDLDGCYLALPASTTKGSALVYNVMDLHSHCQVDAHNSPLAAMVLSSNGMYMATASEQGTIIRVHLVSQATKQSYSFRRGTYPSTIYSLSFGPSAQFPEILIATSSSGSVHAFSLGLMINQRSKRSNSLLGSMIPDKINGAFEPAHHYVLHNAVPAGAKSSAMVHSIEIVASTCSTSIPAAFRASIFIITYNGYFQEYSLNVNQLNESSWSLEREFSLISTASDEITDWTI
ncbi:WD40 repeat [Cinnamomum micranthum f. kanehirae]|uniref:WD40 repeat n=1 Tax=Cinnamomum micranthum f. kanehirae TaxID=337451 RepID=A0A3S3MV53_9MAGN|nr:WD40 repeat [Cinnamomum micranthum f. kanehirae]